MKYFLCLLLLPPVLAELPIRLNLTPSVPVGFYREISIPTAPFIGFCLSDSQLRIAREAGVEMAAGSCGMQPLLKPVFRATREAPIVFSSEGFRVDRALLPSTAPKAKSTSGKPLVHYPFGTYTAGLWAVSSFHEDSFDSRYLGPIDPAQIQFRAVSFLTF